MFVFLFTEVLGFVACQIASEWLWIDSAKESWSALKIKMIMDGKWPNLSGTVLENKAIPENAED